ncbi:hypothetical protein RCL_jg8491.t1 [Rhizophagus clarus]|uniref:Uncharacterized protein n=1 Tax=Rhizophagus clarus TaxID=94130 RepID=A0A8H3MCB5_9GLOM|nr:hypothetical protein RCL_jg8491.t1 [Rhizophagus clarus]
MLSLILNFDPHESQNYIPYASYFVKENITPHARFVTYLIIGLEHATDGNTVFFLSLNLMHINYIIANRIQYTKTDVMQFNLFIQIN